MLKIICALFVITTTTYSAKFNDGCWTSYSMYPPLVCGTDGITYKENGRFQCAQNSEYGKRVNLQIEKRGPCWRGPHQISFDSSKL